jgi:autotransporter-associated beta strand protein
VLTNRIAEDQTIYLNQRITNGSLTLGAADGAHAFTLAGNGGSLVFQSNGSPAVLAQTAASPGDVVAADALLLNSLVVRNDSANAFTVSGSLSGPGGLSQSGPGTVVLSGVKTYSGVTAINGGVLKLQGGKVSVPVARYARWFDASIATYLATNASGLVTQWYDLSASHANATPLTGHSPAYVPGALNGLGAIHFGPGLYHSATNSDSLNFTQDTAVRSV